MQILKKGKKELVGKVFFSCWCCECEFIADEGEWKPKSDFVTDPTTAYINCPNCGTWIRAEIDGGHKEALYKIREVEAKKGKSE